MVKLNRRQSSAGKTAAGTVAARSKAPASAKVAAKRPNVKRRKQPDEPPVDRPDQRHRQLIQDRRFGSEGKNLAQLRLDALGEKAAAGCTSERSDRQPRFAWREQLGAARTDRHSERTDRLC